MRNENTFLGRWSFRYKRPFIKTFPKTQEKKKKWIIGYGLTFLFIYLFFARADLSSIYLRPVWRWARDEHPSKCLVRKKCRYPALGNTKNEQSYWGQRHFRRLPIFLFTVWPTFWDSFVVYFYLRKGRQMKRPFVLFANRRVCVRSNETLYGRYTPRSLYTIHFDLQDAYLFYIVPPGIRILSEIKPKLSLR